MVDFQTQNRHNGYRYNAPDKREPEASFRDLYRETNPLVFHSERTESHDCRAQVMQDYTDKRLWEAALFNKGMLNTCQSVEQMHKKTTKEVDGERVPDKLLYNIGKKGKAKGDMDFPRSLACCEDGNIIVADTKNQRIQRFNECAVYVEHFGEKGRDDDQFLEPTGVAVLQNGRIVVADRKLKCFKVFSEGGRFRHSVSTKAEPFYVAADSEDNIVVSTTKKTIEVYRRQGSFWKEFSLGAGGDDFAPCPIAVNDKYEVIVCDRSDSKIKFYTFSGKLLYEFEPSGALPGLATMPASVCLNPKGEILVADTLNHAVNLYSERGKLLEQVLCPTDDAGALQAIAVGPQGNINVTEFSVKGPHCLKVFRYMEIEGRPVRPGSSKRPSRPTSSASGVSAKSAASG